MEKGHQIEGKTTNSKIEEKTACMRVRTESMAKAVRERMVEFYSDETINMV